MVDFEYNFRKTNNGFVIPVKTGIQSFGELWIPPASAE
jgi:hypothetical protein